MSIVIKAIKFNHSSNSFSSDAITIRKNKTETVNIPEWVDGISVQPEDSLAAYAMKETQGNTITIQARFQSTNVEMDKAYIRAIDADVNPPGPGGCLGWLIKLLRAILKALFGNCLGEVKEREVVFINGDSGFVTFDLINTKIWSVGVSIRNTNWQWQYRRSPNDSWQNMQITKHKIYIILSAPNATWNQAPGSDQLPWTEVLNYSCSWAFGAKDRDTAAAKITQSVYNLGPSVIEYDCPGRGDRHYATYSQTFNCTKFLERLKGGNGNGQYVNCTDCATIVSTFSNILGCDLWASRMEGRFRLNPILAIGSSVWKTACGWQEFNYHEVAWKNNCTANDEIFDACLQVDGDADPTTAPHTPLLATNLKFGDCSTMNYRLRLCPPTADGCNSCTPNPPSRVKRPVY